MDSKDSIRALGGIELRTRREVILDRLREAVIDGRLPPGTHLGEVELSESLGVSRGTLREAFRHLQQEGLLVADSRGRLSVRVLLGSEVREIFQVRTALENLGLELVCASPERGDAIAALERAIERMDDPVLGFADRVQADLDFHEVLVAASDNATLASTWRSISGLVRAAIVAAGPGTALHNMQAERHRPLIEHIRLGDALAARDFLRTHMESAVERIVERLDERAS